MKNNQKRNSPADMEVSPSSLADLRGRQSVRATFKLSDRAVDMIRIVANQMGIKQKSLFDHLIGQIEAFSSIEDEIKRDISEGLNRIQKTFVLSRKTLSELERISRDCAASRNTLIECSIQRLMPLISLEQKKHRKRKEMLNESEDYLDDGLTLLSRYKDELGVDDPVYAKFENAISGLAAACREIEKQIVKGQAIEDF